MYLPARLILLCLTPTYHVSLLPRRSTTSMPPSAPLLYPHHPRLHGLLLTTYLCRHTSQLGVRRSHDAWHSL